MRVLKKTALVFFLSFALNLVWENLHATLYTNYQGGPISNTILLHATLADALIITAGAFLFLYVPYLRRNLWLSLVLGILIAIGVEMWALETGRWAYSALMPLTPFVKTGLTPTLQLGLLGYVTYRIVDLGRAP